MDSVIGILSTILEPVVAPIKRHIGYAFEFRSTRTAFSGETRKLKLAKEGLQDSIAAAQARGEEVKPRVLGWLTEAERAVAGAEALVQNGQEEAQRCCSFNLMTRYRMGKEFVEGKPGIVQLLMEKGEFGTDICLPHEGRQIVRPQSEGYEAPSRTEILKEVMRELLDPNIPMVGVYGMGGIGKTTLANEVYCQAGRDNSFYKVVKVEVTAKPDINSIQDEIANFVINFKLEGPTVTTRATELYQRIMEILKDKQILIILDDLWSELDLDKVGIPTWNDSKNCKILLTSRNQGLLCEMGSNKNFGLRILSKEESRSLFEKKLTRIEYPEIADDILAICDGFPLMIVTAAGLLKKKSYDFDAWKDAFAHLSKFRNEVVERKVYSVLELSYNHLLETQTDRGCGATKIVAVRVGWSTLSTASRRRRGNLNARSRGEGRYERERERGRERERKIVVIA